MIMNDQRFETEVTQGEGADAPVRNIVPTIHNFPDDSPALLVCRLDWSNISHVGSPRELTNNSMNILLILLPQ